MKGMCYRIRFAMLLPFQGDCYGIDYNQGDALGWLLIAPSGRL